MVVGASVDPNVALLLSIYFYVFLYTFVFFLKMLRMSVFLDVQNVLTIDEKHSALGGMV